ncbi:MAG: hypothetical protein OXT72_05570 [Gammaproteobacteria bacterium]|nr:hypothetical protein [Gammaproteobacteria bacterium]MDE0247778.1 hypothetical protein [Gammaproteobacteria bacterium]
MLNPYRSALVAVLLVIGAASCGDEMQVVDVVPVTPALTASIVPASGTAIVGSNVVFAVDASGGEAGSSASWTCASSNTGIATVSVVEAGCRATAVAAGTATVTATVTKSGGTATVGAQLTVTEAASGKPASLIMSLPAEFEARALEGTLDVTLNVERGDRTLERLSLLVDGEEVAHRSFADPATAAPEDDAAARQAIYAFTLALHTDAYDAVTGVPEYENGEHTISAELRVTGGGTAGQETISSNAVTVSFGNADAWAVTADLGDNSAVGDDGRRWYGGPVNGAIEIAALPVRFSGEPVSAVTVNFCFEDITDSEAPYEFTFECEGVEAGVGTPQISSDGTSGDILNIDDLPFPAFIDFVGPGHSPVIAANPNGREDGWINAAVSLTAERRRDTDDAWLVEPADKGDEGGVGGYNMMVRFGEDLKAAATAPVSSKLPAESRDAAAYCAVASAADDLGNESPLADTTTSCRAAPAAADRLIDHDNDPRTEMVYGQIDGTDSDPVVAGQHLEFGVDTTPPTIEFAEDYDEERRYATVPVTFAFEPADAGNSGLDGDAGVVAGIQQRTASKTVCLVIAYDGSVGTDARVQRDCEASTIGNMDVTLGTAAAAYYRLHARARDKAGNHSNTLRHTFVHDGARAVATAPTVLGSVEAGQTFAAASVLNDDLSIRDYYMTADFGEVLSLGAGGPVGVDGFNSLELTNLNHAARMTVDAYAGLQSSVGGAVHALDGVSVYVRDQAQEDYGDGQTTGITVADAPNRSHGFQRRAFRTGWVGRDDSDVYAFCGVPVCEDEDAALVVKIEFRAIAREAGAFPNPFERVDFWMTDVNGASWFFGSDATGTSGRKGSDGDDDFFRGDDHFRTWSYSIVMPGTLLAAIARTDTNEGSGTAPLIRAIGVNENDVGVVTSTGVAIDMAQPGPAN